MEDNKKLIKEIKNIITKGIENNLSVSSTIDIIILEYAKHKYKISNKKVALREIHSILKENFNRK